jgi:excisionase family DNA binding protein
MNTNISQVAVPSSDQMSTLEVARVLGLAVRSVQLMVDRGELEAWKTPGGHRRISRQSVERWRDGERQSASLPKGGQPLPEAHHPKVLLIEDSMHFQNLIGLLVRQKFPNVELRSASDGIAGLAMAGQFQPDVLMVDILLPGIDGAALITSLRSHPQFGHMQIIVVTSLDKAQLEPYAFALADVPVVHKPRLVVELPPLLAQSLELRNHALS